MIIPPKSLLLPHNNERDYGYLTITKINLNNIHSCSKKDIIWWDGLSNNINLYKLPSGVTAFRDFDDTIIVVPLGRENFIIKNKTSTKVLDCPEYFNLYNEIITKYNNNVFVK